MTEYKWPIDGEHVITAGWWYPDGGLHRAIDVRCAEGTPVKAMRDGTVVWRQNWDYVTKTGDMSYGNAVKIRHDDGTYELMAHFSKIGSQIKVGYQVKQGEIIAYSGSTGNSTGPHLHIEIRTANNERRHPLDFLAGPIEYASAAVEESAGMFTSPKEEEPKDSQYYIILKMGPVTKENMDIICTLLDAMGDIHYTISEA